MNTIYHGYNIHAYTPLVKKLLAEHYTDELWQQPLDEKEYITLLTELKDKYGSHPAIANIDKCSKSGYLLDPQLGRINFLQILVVLWESVKTHNTFTHFKETLDHIGMTCIQGVSHRILIDWVAMQDDNENTG